MLLFMFQVWQGIPGIICNFFLPRHGRPVFIFEILDSIISKDIQANPCGFIAVNRKGCVNKYVRFHGKTLNQTAEAII